jgi:hypothetical protein
MTDLAQNALAAKRVGQYLIDAGVLTASQLDEALDRQRRMSKAGFHVLLGTILEEMGAIDRQSLEAIILRQRLDEGSVNLGPEIDWSPFRPKLDAEAPGVGSDFPAVPNYAGSLTPERAAEAMDAFFGQADDSADVPDSVTSTPEVPAQEAAMHDAAMHDVVSAPPWFSEVAPEAQTQSVSFVPMEPQMTVSEAAEVASDPPAMEQATQSTSKSWFDESLPRFPFFGRKSNNDKTENTDPVTNATETTPEAMVASSAPMEDPLMTATPSADSAPSAEVLAATTDSWTSVSSTTPVADVTTLSVTTPDAPATTPTQAEPEATADTTTVPTEPAEVATPSHVPPTTVAPVATEKEAAASETVEPAAVASEPDADATSTVDLQGFKFSRSTSGLAASEVSAVIGQLIRRTRTLEEQVAEAKETLSHLDSMRRYGEQSVRAADTIAQQIREEAEDQALAIRDRAQQEARKIVSEARTRHDEIVRAAGSKAMEVSVEVAREIDEHRSLNETFCARAQALLDTDTSSEA